MDMPSAAHLIGTLDAEELRRQLDVLDAERAALLVLLRAARARERRTRAPAQGAALGREVSRAG
jgi:hypothetical protein